MLNDSVPPALRVPPSGVFTMLMFGQFTVTEAESVSDPSLPVATEAVLDTRPQVAAVVDELMWIGPTVPPPAMVPRLQVSVPAAMAQSPKASTDQDRPAVVGRTSVTTTLVAEPVPWLWTMMSKPIVSPALTGPAGFADLWTSMI